MLEKPTGRRRAGLRPAWTDVLKACALASFLPAIAAPSAVLGASASTVGGDDAAMTRLDEIIVTSQRRAQNVRDVPTSLTVFDDETIEFSRIEETPDILQRTPNVSFNTTGSILTNEFGIRGVTNIGGVVNANGVYVDEFNITPLNASSTLSPELVDIERVEVLRGPQGTLFGRNVTGGAISITSRKPEDTFSASVTGEYARFDSYFTRGVVNIPLADGLAMRASAFYRETDGFLTDIEPAGGIETNARESFGGRLAVRARPVDALTIDVSATYRDYAQGLDDAIGNGDASLALGNLLSAGADIVLIDLLRFDSQLAAREAAGLAPPGTAAAFSASRPIAPPEIFNGIDDGQGFFPENETLVSLNEPFGRKNELLILNGRAAYELDGVTLIGNFGYIESDTAFFADGDLTSLPITAVDNRGGLSSWSGEFRVQSDDTGPFNWTAGVLYADDRQRFNNISTLNAVGYLRAITPFVNRSPFASFFPGGVILPPAETTAALEAGLGFPPGALAALDQEFRIVEDTGRERLQSFGVFGDATWTPGEGRLSISAGLRYSRDTVNASFFTPGGVNPLAPGGFEALVDFAGGETFNLLTPRAAVLYRAAEGLNLYASVSRGAKPGGINLGAAESGALFGLDLPGSFDEESLWNYEVGLKGVGLDGRLGFSAAVFYADWSDLQVTGRVVAPSLEVVPLTQNIPSAETYGVEAEVVVQPFEGLILSGNAGFNETEIGVFSSALDNLGEAQDVTGNDLPLAPRWTAAMSGEYETPVFFRSEAVGAVNGRFLVEYVYRGGQFLFITDQGQGVVGNRAPQYDFVNLRAGLASERFDLTAFVENVGGETYISGFRAGETLNGVQVAIVPRTYGVRLTVNFE